MATEAVIVSMARTPVGSFGGSLSGLDSVEIGVIAARAALDRAGLGDGEVDEAVFGCVGQHGLNAFLARLVSLRAGIHTGASAQTVNRMCASGLQAIVTGCGLIESGQADVVLAGGAESMSNYPYLLPGARWGMRMGAGEGALLDALNVALCEPTSGPNTHIATTAENVAERFGLTRREVDAYALLSQTRALAAIEAGLFEEQIVPVELREKAGPRQFAVDEHVRRTSMEQLGKLKPFARKDGVVTAGNAAGINDGAAALVLMSRSRADALGLRPLARVLGWACTGVDPQYMGLGPVDATSKLMAKLGMGVSDMDLVELNEAFATQAVACVRALGLDMERVNVNGSGISLGHPIGATGAVISIKLICELRRRGARYGLASLCIGGGQGMSAVFEAL